jgi:serine/threonine-protein kinase
MTDDLIGKTIGGYEVIRLLGQGGMARVYLARQQSMNRYVALKMLPKQYLNDDTYLQRFEREIKIVSQLEHRSIIPVHDYGEHHGVPYIVMRYMPAGSVDDLLQNGALTLDKTLNIVAQIAPALDYAHTRDVLHRDLKPGNVLLDDDGGAFITDFGIARVTNTGISAITTQGVVGTPSYMSPEQAQGKKLDGRSDVYSLGVMLFEMATGKRPFESDTPYSIAVMQVTTPPPMPRSYNPELPSSVESVILRALRKNPDDRYQTALSLSEALKMAIERPETGHDTEPSMKKPSVSPQPAPMQPLIVQPAPMSAPLSPPGIQPVIQPNTPAPYSTGAQNSIAPMPAYRPGIRSRLKSKRASNPLQGMLMGGLVGCGLLMVMIVAGLVVAGAAGLLPFSNADDPTLTPTRNPEITPDETPAANIRPTLQVSATNTLSPLDATSEAARQALFDRITRTAAVLPTDIPPPTSDNYPTPFPLPQNNALIPELQTVQGVVLFAAQRDNSFEILTLALPSLTEMRLTNNQSDDSYPLASPDGQWIAFQSDRDGDFDIYVMDTTGGQLRKLTENSYIDRLAAWSPDGEWVVFSSDIRQDGNFDIFRVRRDGSQLEAIYSSAERKSHARYSPDGRYLVFTAGSPNDASTWEIIKLDLVTGERIQMTNNTRRDASPLFNADGSRILFITMLNDNDNAIAIMNADGTDARILYNSPGSDWAANFSPDGRYIVFSSNPDGITDQLFLMLADGSGVQQITTNEGAYPSWLIGS